MKRIWNIISTFILACMVLMLIAFGGCRLFGITPYVVSSGSMEPEYPVGSLIYAKEVPAEQIKVGDDITFYTSDDHTIATHRVYEIEDEQFRTQGINNKDSDGNILHDAKPVSVDNLIGTPILMIPYLGYVNQFCTTTPGVYILLGAALVIIAVSWVIDKRQRYSCKPQS